MPAIEPLTLVLMLAVRWAAVEVSTLSPWYSYHWNAGFYSYSATDMPILVDDDGSDAELDVAASDDDDDRTLGATLAPDAGEDRHTLSTLSSTGKASATEASNPIIKA